MPISIKQMNTIWSLFVGGTETDQAKGPPRSRLDDALNELDTEHEEQVDAGRD